MNPVEASLLEASYRAPETSGGPYLRLTPARPGAVNVPALVVTAGVAGGAAAIQAIFGGAASPWVIFAAGVVALATLGHAYAARVLLRSKLGRARSDRILVPLTAAFALGFGFLVPVVTLHPAAFLAAWLLTLVGLQIGSAWRESWLRQRRNRVSLLAPSEMAAQEAIERLEALPGLQVITVAVPGCVVERATRMLGRPVVRGVGGRTRLQDRVVVSCPQPDARVGSTIAQLVALGHTITSETAAMRRAEGRVDSRRANALNLLMGIRQTPLCNALRRAIDIVVSAVVLALLSPVLLAAAIAIVIDSGFPVFYRQGRVGRRGKLFQVLKFRSMTAGAENGSGPVFASREDPRITAVGRFLRGYRIDELPQFVNVFLGQMSLVGPRPERPHFFNVLRKDVPLFELRTYVRPGITGWAQIRLPYAADADDARAKLEYDLYYITHRSLWFDLAVLLETVGVVLSAAGAR